MHDIIIVDDEKDIRSQLAAILTDEGHSTRTAADSDSFFELLSGRIPSLIILDIWLKKSKLDGMEILFHLQKSHKDIPVIIISGHGTIEIAVRAMKSGAFNFLEKPLKIDHLLLLVNRATEKSKSLKLNNKTDDNKINELALLGKSAIIKEIIDRADANAPHNSRIFISGKKGTGKKSLARYIHKNSPRAEAPFIEFHPARYNHQEMEFKLFGTGDVTGLQIPKSSGALEKAHNGTIYICGIEYMPKPLQQKLTKFLVDGYYIRPMSQGNKVECDVRVMTSCHSESSTLMQEGKITQDLFNRISIIHFKMPMLNIRKDDIEDMINEITKKVIKSHKLKDIKIPKEIIEFISQNINDLNISLLYNKIEHLVLSADYEGKNIVTSKEINYKNKTKEEVSYSNLTLRDAREIFEKEYLLKQLSRFDNNISKTSQFIGMERSALHRKMRSLGISGRYEEKEIETI